MQGLLKNRRIALAQASDLAVAAVSWWVSELSAMFPWLTRLGKAKTRPALLRLGRHQCTLLVNGSASQPSGDSSPAGVEFPGLSELAAWCSRLGTLCAGHGLHVSMATEDVLPLELELPAAARSDLGQAVSYRLLTESPIDPTLVLHAAKPRKDESAPERLRLDVVISRKGDVEEVLTALRNCGISVGKVGYALPGSGGLDYVFQTSEMEKSAQVQRRRNLYLVALAMAVFTAYFPVTILAAKWLERDARGQILALQTPDRKQAELEARQAQIQTVRQELAQQLPPFRVTSLINAAAQHLPESAWVRRFEYANGRVLLAGQAVDPSVAVRELKKAGLFGGAKLEAVARAPNAGEPPQFEISAVIAGGQI